MPSEIVSARKVSLFGIKRFALEMLPEGPLRDDILSQPDEVFSGEYLTNCGVWLRLARAGG
jgi:hypothetical protein